MMVFILNPNIPLLHRILKTHDLCNRDTQSRVNRSASKVGWGCRQSWAEDVQAHFDCQGHSQSCNFLLSETKFCLKNNLVVGLKFFTNFWMLYIAIEESRVIVDYWHCIEGGDAKPLMFIKKCVCMSDRGVFLP